MSVNNFLPHVLVIPEDDANSQLADGFYLEIGGPRQMQVMPVANGWKKVLASFRDDYLKDLERTPARSIVLLIDFDEQEDRFAEAQTFIPNDLSQRVFILGALNEPED